MVKTRLHIRPKFDCDRSTGGVPPHSNCDSIIEKIKHLFYLYGEDMSLTEKQQLLDILTQIEKNKKCIDTQLKSEMHKIVELIKRKYLARDKMYEMLRVAKRKLR